MDVNVFWTLCKNILKQTVISAGNSWRKLSRRCKCSKHPQEVDFQECSLSLNGHRVSQCLGPSPTLFLCSFFLILLFQLRNFLPYSLQLFHMSLFFRGGSYFCYSVSFSSNHVILFPYLVVSLWKESSKLDIYGSLVKVTCLDLNLQQRFKYLVLARSLNMSEIRTIIFV